MIDLMADPNTRDLKDISKRTVRNTLVTDCPNVVSASYQIQVMNLAKEISNEPPVKSVFYPIKNFPIGNLGEPFCYTEGVYDGKFGQVIGKGGEGTVIEGVWNGKPAAYKFVLRKNPDNDIADMNERLKEMTEMMATPGNAILSFQAHYR